MNLGGKIMKKRTAIFALASVLLLGLSVFAQQQPPAKTQPAPKQAPQGQEGPLAKAAGFLNLTPEQIQKFKDLQKSRQDDQKAFRDQMQKLRGELQPLVRDQKADPAKVNGLIDQIAKLGADRTKKALAGRGAGEKILTPEQTEKIKTAPPALRQMLMNLGRGQGMGMGMGMGPMGGRGGMMQPGMRGQGMGRGQGQGGQGMQGLRQGMGGQGMGMGRMGGGMGMGRGMGMGPMQRHPLLRRLLQMRRMGGRFGGWW
jgi:Spy/CpxP family protein refolding chaperone